MQDLYEKQQIVPGEPTVLVDEIRKRLNVITTTDQTFKQNGVDIFHFKETVPISQLFALYAINKISSLANRL